MIKSWPFFIVSAILLVVVIYFAVNRFIFLSKAERVIGQVESVTASNERCSKKRRRRSTSRYDCTVFKSRIGFTTLAGERGTFVLSAGSVKGHNQPITWANDKVGDRPPVLYNPKNIGEVYRDSFWDVWGAPFVTFLFQLFFMLGSLLESKKGRYRSSLRYD